jgi:2-deoxy-D-gluconate 3-dehydrogenase
MTDEYFNIAGKKTIVAGGAGDLGQHMVAALMKFGTDVVLMDIAEDTEEIAKRISDRVGGSVTCVTVDLTERAAIHEGFDKAIDTLGTVDILVNAQGIQRRYPAEDFPLEDWDEVLEINLTSVFETCQLAGRVMLKNGHGKIINIASMQSYFGGITIPAYAASKAGVSMLTKALSNEWAGRGVNVNAIAPGYMDTKMTAAVKADPVRYENILARIPAGYWGSPDDLCGPLLFLASPASDYVNGVTLPVDGGMLGR